MMYVSTSLFTVTQNCDQLETEQAIGLSRSHLRVIKRVVQKPFQQHG
jgi:hypothetical protein